MKPLCYVILGIFAVLITGCQKEESLPVCQGSCTTIRGQLITGQSQVGIGGAGVTAKWITSTGIGSKAKVKARTTTDANGNYQISFFIEDAELLEGYFAVSYEVDKNLYYAIGGDEEAFHKLKRDTTLSLKPYLIPRKAYIRLAISNPAQLPKRAYLSDFNNCYGHNLIFSRAIQGGGAVVFWDDMPLENPMPIAGDQSVLVRGYKSKNGTTIRSTDSLFIPAGTTQNYTVTY